MSNLAGHQTCSGVLHQEKFIGASQLAWSTKVIDGVAGTQLL